MFNFGLVILVFGVEMDERRRNPCLVELGWKLIISGTFGDERDVLAVCSSSKQQDKCTSNGDYLAEAKIK